MFPETVLPQSKTRSVWILDQISSKFPNETILTRFFYHVRRMDSLKGSSITSFVLQPSATRGELMLAIGLKDFDFLKALRVQVFIYLCFHYFVMRFKIGCCFFGDGFLFWRWFIFGWFFILGGGRPHRRLMV